jgi:CheY-like chemotaxis protein
MWAESEVGKGSTFHITLMVESVEPERQSSTLPHQNTAHDGSIAHTHSPLAGKRVLLVDDNPTNRLVLCRQLQLWGILPYAAASGPEALAWLRRGERFDAAILDLHMPGMDGLMLAKEIRRLGKYVKIKHGFSLETLPLVLLTTIEPGSSTIIDSGVIFAACLTKPVKQALLHEALISLFAERPRPAQRPQPAAPKMDAQMAEQYPLRILVAEDNRLNQKVIVRLLQRMGYQADVAINGIETLEALKHQTYDVVLMDVQMPEMDGWETTRHIRTLLPAEHQPRIIAMTAHALREDREQCLAMGMDDYISKPIHVEELQEALKRVSRHVAGHTE